MDDEPGVRSALSGVLRDEGYAVEAAESGEQCLDRVLRQAFDVVVLDVWLPGLDGLATLAQLRQMKVDAQIVMISGHGNIESAVKAIKMGAYDFVEKPLSLEKTVLVVRNALRQRRLEAENRALRARVGRASTMVGESTIMRELREQVAMAAPTNGRVLIFGENGTGKELVARTIHALSRRRNQPFVEVNCAAIPEELIESELFGHVKGSFTGAVADRKGKFEAAHSGTIFLDEIGDMSVKTQAKVLRVLQEQVTEPVGSTSRVQVDVRVLAATNKDLLSEIRAGRFREDLYFRLNVIPIFVPPLRERLEDIPLLVDHFVQTWRSNMAGVQRPWHVARSPGSSHTAGRATFENCAMSSSASCSWPRATRSASSTWPFWHRTPQSKSRSRSRRCRRCRFIPRAISSNASTSFASWRISRAISLEPPKSWASSGATCIEKCARSVSFRGGRRAKRMKAS